MGSQRQLLRMLQSKKCNDQGLEWHPSSECIHQAALFNSTRGLDIPSGEVRCHQLWKVRRSTQPRLSMNVASLAMIGASQMNRTRFTHGKSSERKCYSPHPRGKRRC